MGKRGLIGSRNTFGALCFFDGSVAVLAHGFQKKIRKTPRIEIEKVKGYRTDYLHRRENERSAEIYRKSKKERL